MKTSITIIIALLFAYINAQEHPFCSTECIFNNEGERGFDNFEECNVAGPFAAAFHLRHKHVTNYRPYPNSNVALKTIRVNIIVITEPGEPMPFEFNETLLGYMNSTFVNSDLPPVCNDPNNDCPCPTPANPDYIEDSRIRVEVVNVRQLVDDSYTYSWPVSNSQRTSWHLNQYPEDIHQLNWYFVKQQMTTFNGLVSGMSSGSGTVKTIITTTFREPNDPPNYIMDESRIELFFKKHFPHELGHVLNLAHPNEMRSFVTNNPIDNNGYHTAPYEFFDDVYRGTNFNDVGDGGDRFGGCNNLMGYGETNGWISPKQMGVMHRTTTLIVNYTPVILGTYNVDHDLLININHDVRNYVYGYSEIPIIVDEDEEWNFPMKCYNDIVVKKGATLILSCRLEMVPQAKIIVEEGGTLIVDGATITSARCGGPDKEGLWGGIEVWGDINFSQTATDADGNLRQGKIVVKNNALIEHAYVAIQANKTGSWVSGGGIILVDEAQIKNCWKGIHFSQYPNFVNISKITRTDFEINDDWKLPTKPIDFIQGWKFRGVEVSLCNFVNNHPVHPMNGIYVENAHIYVRGFKPNSVDVCDDNHESWKPNRFVNLRKGIEGVWLGGDASAGIGFTPVVVKNVFVNCHKAIINNGMPNFTVDANKIFLGHPSENLLIGIGIHQIGGVNYNIRENCIVQENEDIEHICVGILVDNSGGDNNQIYKNYSHNVELAFLAQNRNKTNSTDQFHSGLQFLCNQNFGEQTYDFAVTAWHKNDPLVGIRYLQGGNGLENQPLEEVVDAGNTYTHTCAYAEADYYNGVVSPFIYYHPPSNAKTPQNDCYSNYNISLVEITQYINTCPTKFKPVLPNGEAVPWPYDFVSPWPTEDPLPWPDDIRHRGLRPLEEIEADFVVANTQFLAMAILYNAVIDNGDPQSLLQYIYPTGNVSAMDVRLALLDVSPYISKETIYALVEENTLLSNQDLLEIIAANPDVAHDEELLRMLREKANPMDEWMVNFLRNMGTYTTDRTVLEWQFAGAIYRRQSLAWEMVMALAQQPNMDKPLYYSWLDAIGTTRALYQKAEDMASSGNFTSVQNVMQNINISRLDRWETDEYYAMQYWFELLENLHNTNRNLKVLDSTELLALTVFASNYDLYGLAGIYAKNVLNLHEPESHFFDVILPEQNRSASRGENRVLKPLPNNHVFSLFAFPNPTQQQATIFINQKIDTGKIRVYDLNGVEVLQRNLQSTLHCILDFESLPNGVYFVVLIDENNTKLAETKITVSK